MPERCNCGRPLPATDEEIEENMGRAIDRAKTERTRKVRVRLRARRSKPAPIDYFPWDDEHTETDDE